MFRITTWAYENWELIVAAGVLIILFSMTGTISRSVKTARDGLKESLTPTGFIILLALAYVAYQIYLSVMETL